jgi:hypothetical protein
MRPIDIGSSSVLFLVVEAGIYHRFIPGSGSSTLLKIGKKLPGTVT